MHVLISGAGIAGNTLAYFLSLSPSLKVTVIERNTSCLTQGHNIDVKDSAVKVLDRMGVLKQVRSLNTGEKGTTFRTPGGYKIAHFPVGTENSSPTSEFEILRGDLSNILYDKARESSSVDFKLGRFIKEINSDEEGTSDNGVTVKLDDGTSISADALVLADGQGSRLRGKVFSAEDVTVVDKNLYISYASIPRTEKDDQMWNIYHAGKRRAISLRPDPHGTTRVFTSVMPRNVAEKQALETAVRGGAEAQRYLIRTLFKGFGGPAERVMDGLDTAKDYYFQNVIQLKMKKWSKGRIICLGDTAYCPSPITGMGTTLALTGAYTLAGELTKEANSEGTARIEKAFDSFESKFRPFVEQGQSLPSFVPAVAHPESWYGVLALRYFAFVANWVVAVPGLLKLLADEGKDQYPLPEYDAFVEGLKVRGQEQEQEQEVVVEKQNSDEKEPGQEAQEERKQASVSSEAPDETPKKVKKVKSKTSLAESPSAKPKAKAVKGEEVKSKTKKLKNKSSSGSISSSTSATAGSATAGVISALSSTAGAADDDAAEQSTTPTSPSTSTPVSIPSTPTKKKKKVVKKKKRDVEGKSGDETVTRASAGENGSEDGEGGQLGGEDDQHGDDTDDDAEQKPDESTQMGSKEVEKPKTVKKKKKVVKTKVAAPQGGHGQGSVADGPVSSA